MSQTQETWRKLDFFCDDEGSCALTIYINDTRLHIIADAAKFDSESKTGQKYHDLVQSLRHSQSTDDGNSKEKDSRADSGVDVDETQEEAEEQDPLDIEERIQRWMTTPVLKVFKERAGKDDVSNSRTIQEWYNCPTRFYDLTQTNPSKDIEAVELEADDDLSERMFNLLPEATLPKYITDKIDATYYSASDFTVLEASDQPPGTPYHPCRVQHRASKAIHFLKVVDNTQPQAAKREIQILQQIKERGLHEQFNVPLLEGLVMFDDVPRTAVGKKRIMGFLLTDIFDPLPLTTMLRSDVAQEKREIWAKEVQRVKDLLHDNGIIWGDSKADNFMLDIDEELWIIDFGGGYTENWVEPELVETEDGDNQGVRKVINALVDPKKYVIDEREQPAKEATEDQKTTKRKRGSAEPESDRACKVKRN